MDKPGALQLPEELLCVMLTHMTSHTGCSGKLPGTLLQPLGSVF